MIFYGRNIALEALKSTLFQPTEVLIQEGINSSEKINSIIDLAKARKIPVREISRNEISDITKSDEHQGIAINVNYGIKKLTLNQTASSAYIYISTATFEHNIGAIIRTAEVGGFAGVIIPKNVEITPTVAKTSAGAIFHIPVFSASIFNCIKLFEDNDFNIFGIERDGETYSQVDLTENSLFIIGGEDKSLSDAVRKKCDNILEIPQYGKINSLNMSVASAIIIYERVRQLNSVS